MKNEQQKSPRQYDKPRPFASHIYKKDYGSKRDAMNHLPKHLLQSRFDIIVFEFDRFLDVKDKTFSKRL